MGIGVAEPIFTWKKVLKAVWENFIHTLQHRENIVVIIHIYGAKTIFPLFCDHQDTESKSFEIYNITSQPIFTHK